MKKTISKLLFTLTLGLIPSVCFAQLPQNIMNGDFKEAVTHPTEPLVFALKYGQVRMYNYQTSQTQYFVLSPNAVRGESLALSKDGKRIAVVSPHIRNKRLAIVSVFNIETRVKRHFTINLMYRIPRGDFKIAWGKDNILFIAAPFSGGYALDTISGRSELRDSELFSDISSSDNEMRSNETGDKLFVLTRKDHFTSTGIAIEYGHVDIKVYDILDTTLTLRARDDEYNNRHYHRCLGFDLNPVTDELTTDNCPEVRFNLGRTTVYEIGNNVTLKPNLDFVRAQANTLRGSHVANSKNGEYVFFVNNNKINIWRSVENRIVSSLNISYAENNLEILDVIALHDSRLLIHTTGGLYIQSTLINSNPKLIPTKKAYTSSNYNSNYRAEKLHDGNLSTLWASSYRNSYEFATTDFARPVDVSLLKFKFYRPSPAQGTPKNFYVWLNRNGVNVAGKWVTVPENGPTNFSVSFEGQTADRMIMYIPDTGQNRIILIREIETISQ